MARIEQIHKAVCHFETPYTKDGKLKYYLDANSRYPTKQCLSALLKHAKKIGMLEQIAIVEEPFPEDCIEKVDDLGVMVAADESLHDPLDVVKKIEQGFNAFALKPAGKTLSMTLKMAKEAQKHDIPCFVADSGCPPLIREWNKNVAARLAPIPGLDLGLLESNGPQNYKNWNKLMAEHPYAGADWVETKQGVFNLTEDFYQHSGGIFS